MTTFRQEIRFASTLDGLKIAYASSGRGHPLVRAGHRMTHLGLCTCSRGVNETLLRLTRSRVVSETPASASPNGQSGIGAHTPIRWREPESCRAYRPGYSPSTGRVWPRISPAFAGEMMVEQQDVFYYVMLTNENYAQPDLAVTAPSLPPPTTCTPCPKAFAPSCPQAAAT